MTNEDKIKSLDQKQLAEFLSGISGDTSFDLHGHNNFHDYVNSKVCDRETCPIDQKKCPVWAEDGECPYKPWERFRQWLSSEEDKDLF